MIIYSYRLTMGLFILLGISLLGISYQSQAVESLRKCETSRLQELATLLYEQQYFVEVTDAVTCAVVYDVDELTTKHVAAMYNDLGVFAQHYLDLDEQKEISLGDYSRHEKEDCLGIARLCELLQEENVYECIIGNLDRFKTEKMLEPLQALIDVLMHYVPMALGAPGFMKKHCPLVFQLREIGSRYRELLPAIKQYYDSVLNELKRRHQNGAGPLRLHCYLNVTLPRDYQISKVYSARMIAAQKVAINTPATSISKNAKEATVDPLNDSWRVCGKVPLNRDQIVQLGKSYHNMSRNPNDVFGSNDSVKQWIELIESFTKPVVR